MRSCCLHNILTQTSNVPAEIEINFAADLVSLLKL